MEFDDKIQQVFSQYNHQLTSQNVQQFKTFFDMLLLTNESVNLTSITEMDEVIVKHFLDSTMGMDFIPRNAKVLDIGCGAGFPSLPIKILRPDVEFVLIDSVDKKLKFVQSVIDTLKLDKISLRHTRIEDYAKDNAGQFDMVVCRAVAPLNILVEYALPFLKVNGVMMAYKSVNVDEEISLASHALSELSGEISRVERYDIDGNSRSLVFVKKLAPTPKGYPRPRNLPRIRPL